MTEHYTRPDVAMFLQMLNNLPGPRTHEVGPVLAREQYEQMRDMVDLPVGDLAVLKDISIPGPAGPMPGELYDPRESREPGPAVVYYHGGGFTIGSLVTHKSFCAEMARALDLPVVSVDYRLAPEAPYPAAPDDAEAAARWVAGSPAELGRAVTSLVLSGDSAGGNLTIVVAMALRDAPAAVPVIAQLPIYPATDYSQDYPSYEMFCEGRLLTRESMTFFNESYRPDIASLRVSPMLGDLANMPPAVVLTASLDPIRDQGRAYAAALVKAGVPVIFREAVGNIHGFVTFRQAIPSSVGDVAGFMAAARDVIAEAEGERVMAQAAAA